jgi:hypothetical protein
MGDAPSTEETVASISAENLEIYTRRDASGLDAIRLPSYQRSPCAPFRHRQHCEGAQPYKLGLRSMPGSTPERGIAFIRTRESRAWLLSASAPAALGADGGSAAEPRGQAEPQPLLVLE